MDLYSKYSLVQISLPSSAKNHANHSFQTLDRINITNCNLGSQLLKAMITQTEDLSQLLIHCLISDLVTRVQSLRDLKMSGQ